VAVYMQLNCCVSSTEYSD